jgi:hypothetical protein
MNNILSRVVTGVVGGIMGGFFGILISYPLSYLINSTTTSGGGMMSGPGMTYAVLFILGGIFGLVLGLVVGVIQPIIISKGLLYGCLCAVVIEFMVFITINPGLSSGRNLSASDIFGGVAFVSVPIICGAIIGLIVSLTNKAILGVFRNE